MKFVDFEGIVSPKRISRYLTACNGNTRKAMTLYRYNLRLSQEVFTVVSCFEVALRNAIDSLLVPVFGPEWLKNSIQSGGIFYGDQFKYTKRIVNEYQKIQMLFSWMNIDSKSMLYGLDHVLDVCDKINQLM